jgi:hypothetical protein
MLVWTLVFAPGLLALVGVVLLLNSNGIGIALLVLALVVMAIPVSPLLRAMARRREARATKRTPPR